MMRTAVPIIREGGVYPSYNKIYIHMLASTYTQHILYTHMYVYNIHNSFIAIVNYIIMSYPRWP